MALCQQKLDLHYDPQAAHSCKTEQAVKGSKVAMEEIEAWRQCSLDFLSGHPEPDKIGAPKQQSKKVRIPSFDWLARTDHQLLATLNKGLAFWRRGELKEDAEEVQHQCCSENDVLGISCDRGLDGSCALHFLLYQLRCNIVVFWDFNHDGHNDCINAMKETGDIFQRMLLNGIPFNVHFGPFQSQAWYAQCLEAAQRYLQLAVSEADPLFQHFLPQPMKDNGLEHEVGDPDLAQTIFKTAFQSELLTGMGPKLQFSRWHSITDVCNWWLDRRWTPRLIQLTFLGLSMGWLKKNNEGQLNPVVAKTVKKASAAAGEGAAPAASSSSVAGRRKTCKADPADPSAPTARSTAGTNLLRAQCSNQLHAACCVMMDPTQKHRAQLVAIVSEPVRHDIGKSNSQVRTAWEARRHYANLADGSWMTLLRLSMMLLEDESALAAMGFSVDPSPAVLGLSWDDPLVLGEDEEASITATYAMNLVRRRAIRGLSHSHGFPMAFAIFLSEECEPDAVSRVLHLMKDTHEAYTAATTKTKPLVKRVVKRCCMNQAIVATMFGHAEKCGFSSVSADMMDLARNIFRHAFGQTKVNEDALHPCRHAEEHEQSSKQMWPERVYWQPIKAGILSSLHKYAEVDPDSIILAPSDPTKLPRTMYAASLQTCSTKSLYDIVGFGPPSWTTYNSSSSANLESDLAMLRHVHQQQAWDKAGFVWYSVLLARGMIVRSTVLHDEDEWFISLGFAVGFSAYGWPAQKVKVSEGLTIFRPSIDPGPLGVKFLVVTDPRDWVAYPGNFKAPLSGMLSAQGNQCPWPPGIRVHAHGSPRPLLAVCAENCFFNLPQLCIRELCRNEGVQVASENFMDMLQALIKHLRPEVDEPEMHEILSKRLVTRVEGLGEFFEEGALAECFDESDFAMVTEYLEDDKAKQTTAKEYQNKLHEYYRTAAVARAHGKSRSGDSSAEGSSYKKPRKYPPAFPTKISMKAAADIAPPRAHITKDRNENRWRVALKPFGTISRSWQLHGEENALKMVARQLWLWHQSATGEACPVAGIM